MLPEQQFKILLVLIEREGEIATREEIKKRLWPNDTIVEFDHSMNVVMGNLRRALGDSAEEPKYIETLARRGYRLLAPVERVDVAAAEPSSGDGPAAQPQQETVGLIGKKVSHYRVLEIIGGGGMGLVYKAEDLKLGRRVALKFLPEELASDAVALQRFEREAQTASSLNHPNICTIYEVEEHEGQPFIVMELLEGETLRDRLAAGSGAKAIPLDELLEVAVQVCDGLEAAHQNGIIHRDIKPANIFLTAQGPVKILDFGLAKLTVEAPDSSAPLRASFNGAKEEAAEIPSDLSSRAEPPAFGGGVEGSAVVGAFENADPHSTTLRVSASGSRPIGASTSTPCPPGRKNAAGEAGGHSAQDDSAERAEATLTRTGSAMGTAGYMSPEQVRGEKLDARTDIFSFGLVLYEIATGQRAFAGDTAAVVHDAILNKSPLPLRELNSALPAKLVAIIDKALEKDRELRYQSAAEMRADLEKVRGSEHPTGGRLWKWAAAALLIVVAVGGWQYWRQRNSPKLTEKDSIVLADFANSTGDSVFDGTLKQALGIHLEQSPFLNVLSEQKVTETLKVMNQPANERLTYDVTREVCLRSNSRALISGSIAPVGEHFMIAARAVECHSGDTLASAEAEAQDRNQVLRSVQEVGNTLRKNLGESLPSVAKFNQPLEEVTTSSLEALQAFSRGREIQGERGDAEALPYLRRAVELDPNFAYAYSALGTAYRNLELDSQSTESFKRAYELRERVSLRDRLYIEGGHYVDVTGEIEKAIRSYTELKQAYPADAAAHNNLSRCLRIAGRYEMARIEAQEAVRLSPHKYVPVFNLMSSYNSLNRPDAARVVFEEALSRGVDAPLLRLQRYWVAFLQSNEADMQQQLTWAIGKPGAEEEFLSAKADTEAYHGRFVKARAFARDVLRLAASQEVAAYEKAVRALREAEVGNADRARKEASEALQLMPGREVRLLTGLALALAGDRTRAHKIANELHHQFPVDTLVQCCSVPGMRAAIALGERDPRKAIEVLESAKPYDMAIPVAGSLTHVYVRGLAYLQADHGEQAAIEFQKILDHPGIGLTDVAGALAHLQLGRAQVMMGDKAAARKSYQDFLTLWKDADPDIPIYKQAKAEYAKLK